MKPATKPGQPQGEQRSAYVGDEVYFHKAGGPVSGKVVATGRHGCTVEHGGAHHKLKWEHVAGHKKRAQLRYNVVDHGEDGIIVEDGAGQRRYLAMPNEAKDDPMVAKSMGQRPYLLFMKATPAPSAPPGPGLSKKVLTDKNGVQTSRWVSIGAGGPPAQRGQHVGFENGEHKGHGEVVAAGQDGVTVKDRSNGMHGLHHDKITHHWEGEGAPTHAPHEEQAAGANAAKPTQLFSEQDLAGLPDKVNQPCKSWEDLVSKGTEGLAQFREQLGKVAQVMGLDSGKKPEDITPEEWENDKGFLFLAPLKGEKRAKEKCEADYGGDWSQLRDVVRATISVPGMSNVTQALSHLKSVGIQLAQKPKDRFAKPTDEGYRDLMTIVKLPNGMLAELQIHVKAMTLAKEKGHKDYEVTRSLSAKYGEAKPSDKWEAGDKAKFEESLSAQKEIYDTVWTKAQGGGGAEKTTGAAGAEKPMQKALRSSKMIMLFRKSP